MIKPKLKICSVCEKSSYLWKSSPPMCKNCAGKSKIENVTPEPKLKEYFIKNEISPMSDKRKKELAIYRVNRDVYFKLKPVCEFEGCSSTKVTLHHKRGRVGRYLTDMRYFCSLCPKHHTFVNENPDEALKMGLVASRLANVEILQHTDLQAIKRHGRSNN